jgi:hypothetical protein
MSGREVAIIITIAAVCFIPGILASNVQGWRISLFLMMVLIPLSSQISSRRRP